MLNMIRSVVGAVAASVVVGMLAVSAPARADVLFDTLPAHPQFYSNVSSTQSLAVRFTATSSVRLVQVEMGLGIEGPPAATITSAIHADGPIPGAKIQDLTSTLVSPTGTYTATPLATLDLTAGQSYWLVAASQGTNGRWFLSQAVSRGMLAFQNAFGAWSPDSAGLLPAVRITANPMTVACCNAATGACVVMSTPACESAAGAGLSPVGSTCSPAACPVPCAADFDRSGSVTVQDIFDFLAAYFAGCP